MNPAQIAMQLRHKLRAVAWPTGDASVVFGTQDGIVEVFADAPTQEQFPPAFPCCLVLIGDGTPDEDHPQLVEHSFRLVVGAQSMGTPLGSHAVIGGPTQNLGTSENRGVAELLTRVRAAVGDLTGADGAKLQVISSAMAAPFTTGSLRHVAFGELVVSAWCTQDLHYTPPQQLEVSGTSWTWKGAICSSRFDFLTYVLRRKTGSAPTSPTDGTAVYTGTDAFTTQTQVSGETYGIFAQYDGRGDGTADDNSAASVVGTNVTIA